MSFPDPFTNPGFYQEVILGGRPIKSILWKINGVGIEDEWSEQRPTNSSGATNVFKGTKPATPGTLTFRAPDKESFDDLRQIYEMLAPKAGQGANGSGATVGSPGSAAYGKPYVNASSAGSSGVLGAPGVTVTGNSGGSGASDEDLLAQALSGLAAVRAGTNTTAPGASTATATASTAAAVQNPGPKPPTLSIVNGYLNYHGITAVSRKKWTGPMPDGTGGQIVDIEFVLQKAPTPAAVGASSPKTPDNPASGLPLGEIQPTGPAAVAKASNVRFAQVGAE